ncbi:rhodanese family protein [Pectobacterium aroidearum]|uniref:rhodanese family protein n=1 Tax=Pectobacterium aroidearum TaxID=1201031 RepID=UPI002A81B64E|nr:rhodanese family protein [Pectobacterium aroidearum]MDY4386430.1 rhodanese family protein [Pectobacterium aroidearum]
MPTPLAISPAQARKLLDEGAILIDIRQPEEYAREHIAQARLQSLNSSAGYVLPDDGREGQTVIFHCLSGMRSEQNAGLLAQAASPATVFLLEGGMAAWKKAGFPTEVDRKQPIELMRQVQIAAGALILSGVLLGYSVSSAFFLLSGFVGVGLLFAGVTGFCGMARLLMTMPWNRDAKR